jgi:hypothetical protein
MDANKLKVLQEVAYTVNKSCGLCTHGVFPNNDWGTCRVHVYDHLKHTGEARQLSVFRYGSCPRFELHEPLLATMGAFKQFMPA